MAIRLDDLAKKQTERINKLRESDKIKNIEEAIDSAIVRDYKKTTRGWFKKVPFIMVRFGVANLSEPMRTAIWELYRNEPDTFWWLLAKYTAIGWKVKFIYRSDKEFVFSRPAIEQAEENVALAEKTRRIAELKTEIAQIEAEIQFLTESPNSRDPLLLPENAGK